MIIPPDPDKDPALLSPSSSTPSLLPPPTESTSSLDHTIQRPEATHRNPAFGYPFVHDDLAGETLPPYSGRRVRRTSRERRGMGEVDVFRDPMRSPPPVPPRPHSAAPHFPPTPLTLSSPSSHPHTTITGIDTSSPGAGPSTSKLWESSTSEPKSHHRFLPSLPIPPRLRKWWKRWRRYVQIALVLLLIGIGVMIGLLVGLNRRKAAEVPPNAQSPYDMTGDGRRTTSWNVTGESLNITYVASRDGPSPNEGNMTECNLFTPLNSTNNFNLLSSPIPGTSLSLAKFSFPFTNMSTLTFPMANTSSIMFPLTNQTLSLPGDFAITATGLGASGTVEMVGSDASSKVINGTEGMVEVDVIVRYSGTQDLDSTMQVCKMIRPNNGVGVGIYTPVQTDGKVTNAYMINPMLLPSFHVIIRLPPSAMRNPTRSSIYLPSLTFNLDRMGVRFGNMQNIVDFGNITVTSGRGGLVAEYVTAENVDIVTTQNSVRGKWNISQSISVNNTAGSIMSEVILFDPNNTNSAPVPSNPNPVERSITNLSTDPLTAALTGAFSAAQLSPTHTIDTRFFTSQGFVSVAYLSQPPRTALTSIIVTGGGEVDVSMHPNYVGPFVIKDLWGDIRLPPPLWLRDSDPQNQGRSRTMTLGDVNAPDGGLFASAGLNESVIESAGGLITGAVYWGNSTTGAVVKAAKDVQGGDEGKGSELAVLGSWGDVRVTFDGT